jgi:Flp pilus assembly CpaE family ATPase
VLIDADPMFGELEAALGAPDGVRSMGDLLPLGGELTLAHLDETLWTHPEGFRVLLSPPPREAASVGAADLRRVVEVGASSGDVVVLHLARVLDGATLAGFETADRVVEVLSLDVLSFRAAKRTLEVLEPLGLDARVRFVVNRAARGEIMPGDVRRVFGSDPLAVVPLDRAVARAQDHGKLVPARSRTGRALDRLARRLEEDA